MGGGVIQTIKDLLIIESPGARIREHPEKSYTLWTMPPETTQGNIAQESGDTFWSAAKQILEQTFAVLKPGGVAFGW